MRRAPGEIETMPYLDSIHWLTRHAQMQHNEKRFAAALNDKELRS